MRSRSTARERVKLELCILCLLVLAVAAALLWRARQAPKDQSALADASGNVQAGVPTDIPSPTAIPDDMFEWKPGHYVHVERGTDTSNIIDASVLTTPRQKTAADLVVWAKMAWKNQWGYVWGTFGDVLTEDLLSLKIDQFGESVTDYEDIIREKWMGRRTVDCAGLIKSYGWYDADQNQIIYANPNGAIPDIGTDGFFELAPEKGPIDTLPEIPGLLVYAEGHIGVYIGGGYAIEAISHAGGVVKTLVADRTWTHWLKCPDIAY